MIHSLTVAVLLLLLLLAAPAIAADPAGGPGWYQLTPDTFISVPFETGMLVIAGGTPGFLVGVTPGGFLRLRFERGVATARGIEVTADGGFGAALTVDVDPTFVRALLRQPLSRATPGGSPTPTTTGETAFGGGPVGASGSVSAMGRHTTVIIDTTEEIRRVTHRPAPTFFPTLSARQPTGGVDVFQPSSVSVSTATGRPARVIALAEHEEWLAKILRSLGEDGATCQTKGYGPGWISICEPRRSTTPVAVLRPSE